MGGKTEFVTYLKGVYYDALFLTLWNLRNFKSQGLRVWNGQQVRTPRFFCMSFHT